MAIKRDIPQIKTIDELLRRFNFNEMITKSEFNSYKNVMTARLTANYTITATNTHEQLTLSEHNSVGSKLSISNGGIKIGDNISKVLISGKIHWTTVPYANYKAAGIFINSSRKTSTGSNIAATKTVTIAQILEDVNKNDVITLSAYGHAGDIIGCGYDEPFTFLTVVAV